MVHFTCDGKTYRLNFERRKMEITQVRGEMMKTIISKHPYTSALLYEVYGEGVAPRLVGSGKVGCATIDKYSKANGRLYAMKALSRNLAKVKPYNPELSASMWAAYINRGGSVSSPKATPPVAATDQPTV